MLLICYLGWKVGFQLLVVKVLKIEAQHEDSESQSSRKDKIFFSLQPSVLRNVRVQTFNFKVLKLFIFYFWFGVDLNYL